MIINNSHRLVQNNANVKKLKTKNRKPSASKKKGSP